MKRKLLCFVMCLLAISVSAQDQLLKGTVIDSGNEPLIGATVIATGSKSGTITDMDGIFTLNIPQGVSTIEVTYLGYKPQTVNIAGKSDVKIVMIEDGKILGDVVVTALGVKREKKALGYQVQDISGDAINKVQSVSPLGALAGTIAGLNVSSSGSGPGGSVKLLLRGANSITGNNEPLYVIDGVPLDNTNQNQGTDRNFDYGNAASNINADDIENISVLKGGAAAALYGSRGQNGVIMITTKQGKKGGNLEVSFKSNLTFMDPVISPKFQKDYSQGSAGKHVLSDVNSWGVKMEGQSYTNFLNQAATLQHNSENPFKEFLQTGSNFSNTLSVTKGMDKGSFYLSATNLSSDGLFPNEEFDKLNITGRINYELTKYLNVDAKVNYITQEAKDRPRLLTNPDNIIYSLYHMPRSVQLNQLSNYQTFSGYPVLYNKEYDIAPNGNLVNRHGDSGYVFAASPYVQNPYWTANKNKNEDSRKRVLSYAKLDLNVKNIFPNLPLDQLNVMARAGVDYYTDRRKNYEHDRTVYKAGGLATLEVYEGDFIETNYDFLITALKRMNDFGISGSFGGNKRHNKLNGIGGYTGAGIINKEGPYVAQNFNNLLPTESISEQEIQSLYGMLTFDYKSMLYLDLSGRNDWSSTMSPKNWSFFYPSASFSWIASETFNLPKAINFLKLRTSWAEVGNSVSPHQLEYVYAISPNQYMGLPYAGLPSTRPNSGIIAEKTRSFEVGMEAHFLNSRLTLDFAYYNTGTKNQIFVAPAAASTGFENMRINAGHIANKGVELSLKGDVVKTKDLNIGVLVNLSRNFAELEELNESVDLLTVGGFSGGEIQVRKGHAPGLIVGTAYMRDDAGNIMLDEKNLPMKKLTSSGAIETQEILGNCMPKWIAGFGVNLDYKGFMLDLFVDGKFGHQMYSYSNAYGSKIGVLSNTVDGRDEWEMAKQVGTATGLDPRNISGKGIQGIRNGVAGTYYADPQEYYSRLSEITEEYIYSASYLRLQRVSLGYRFTQNFIKKLGIKDLSVSLVGSNLCYLLKHTPNITPNTAFTSGTFGGAETFAYPETRNIGASIGITF